MAVSRQSAHPFAADEILGVAIGMPNHADPQQRHVGLIYRIDDSSPRLCHLAWHFMLEDEPLPTDYFWGSSGLDPVNKVFMAAYVASLKQNASDVPYGIDYGGIYFDDQGRYIVQPLGRGLTCATFILAVFARNGFDLVKIESWPERPDDIEWQQQIIGVLTHRASREHIEAVKQNVGAKRFRPEGLHPGYGVFVQLLRKLARSAVSWFTRGLRALHRKLQNATTFTPLLSGLPRDEELI